MEEKPWVEQILKRFRVWIEQKNEWFVLSREAEGKVLDRKPFSSGKSEHQEKFRVFGFEDYPEEWKDKADIIVKMYELRGTNKVRVEVYCSGTFGKTIEFDGREILRYPTVTNQHIQNRIPLTGTVIFDV